MYLHELRSPEGARTARRRVGRGTGSGRGKTSGRGQKGQQARSEGFRVGFEGGQMPITQRLPKLDGFKNPFKKVYSLVNLTRLNTFPDGATVGPEALVSAGIADAGARIKVLGAGKLRRRLSVEAHAFSQSSRAAIEARGGSVVELDPRPRKIRQTRAQRRAGDVIAEPAAGAEPAAEVEPAAQPEPRSETEPAPSQE